RADFAKDHESGRTLAETFVDVGTGGLLADRHQTVLAQLFLEPGHRIARWNANADPRRLAQGGGLIEARTVAGDLVFAGLLVADDDQGDLTCCVAHALWASCRGISTEDGADTGSRPSCA